MNDEFFAVGYGKEQGLPDLQVRDILQTRDGFLWILTQGGLARFDGTAFRVFNHANTPELNSDNAYALAEDIRGNLWVGGIRLLLRMSGNTFHAWNSNTAQRSSMLPSCVRAGMGSCGWQG